MYQFEDIWYNNLNYWITKGLKKEKKVSAEIEQTYDIYTYSFVVKPITIDIGYAYNFDMIDNIRAYHISQGGLKGSLYTNLLRPALRSLE